MLMCIASLKVDVLCMLCINILYTRIHTQDVHKSLPLLFGLKIRSFETFQKTAMHIVTRRTLLMTLEAQERTRMASTPSNCGYYHQPSRTVERPTNILHTNVPLSSKNRSYNMEPEKTRMMRDLVHLS